jgi:protein-disulfide isomerase
MPGLKSPDNISGNRPPIVNLWLSPMKRYLPFAIVALVALATFGSGFAFYRAKRAELGSGPTSGAASGIHVRGNAQAAVTIEEFGDFQCPPCGIMAGHLRKMEEEYGSRLRLIFHHFPLAMHVHAREAALAAEAAEKQGHFWQMHDLLYKEQAGWSKAQNVSDLFNSYATAIGIHLDRFDKDLQNPDVVARVDTDQKLGASRGVTSTPTLFVNNVALPPNATNPAGVKKAIETALEKKTKP